MAPRRRWVALGYLQAQQRVARTERWRAAEGMCRRYTGLTTCLSRATSCYIAGSCGTCCFINVTRHTPHDYTTDSLRNILLFISNSEIHHPGMTNNRPPVWNITAQKHINLLCLTKHVPNHNKAALPFVKSISKHSTSVFILLVRILRTCYIWAWSMNKCSKICCRPLKCINSDKYQR